MVAAKKRQTCYFLHEPHDAAFPLDGFAANL